MEAAQQLDITIKQQIKKAPMDKLVAIELLRKVLLGERKEPPPPTAFKYQKQETLSSTQRHLPAIKYLNVW